MNEILKLFGYFGSFSASEQCHFLADMAELLEFRRNPVNKKEICFYNPAYRLVAPQLDPSDIDLIVEKVAEILLSDSASVLNRATSAFVIGKSFTQLGFDKILQALRLSKLPSEVVRQSAFAFDNLADTEGVVLPADTAMIMHQHGIPWDSASGKIVVDDV